MTVTGFELVNVDGRLVARDPDSQETFPVPFGAINPESSHIGPDDAEYPFEVDDGGDLVIRGGSNVVLPHPEAEVGDERRTLLYEGGHFERLELEALTLHESEPVVGGQNAASVRRGELSVYGSQNAVDGERRINVLGHANSVGEDDATAEELVVAGHGHDVEDAADCTVVGSLRATVSGSDRSVVIGGDATISDGPHQTVCGYGSRAGDDHATAAGAGVRVDARDGVGVGYDLEVTEGAESSVVLGSESRVEGAERGLLISPEGGELATDDGARLDYDQLERGAVAGTFDDEDRQPGTVVEEIDEEADELVFRVAYGDGEVRTGSVDLA